MDADGRTWTHVDARGRTGRTWTDGTDGTDGMDVNGRDGAISELLFSEPFQNYYFLNQMNGILRKLCSFGPWPERCGMHNNP